MNRAQLVLTKLWLRLAGARFVRVAVVRHEGAEMKVITFTSKKALVLGQLTPFSTIIIHDIVFQSERLLRYVTTHESIHKRQWYRYFIYPLLPVCLLSSACMATYFILLLRAMVQSHVQISPLLPAAALFLAILLVALPCGFSWFLELNADFGAIRKLGRQSVLDAIQDARELMKVHGFKRPSFSQRVFIRMLHPTIGITLRLYELFHRTGASATTQPSI